MKFVEHALSLHDAPTVHQRLLQLLQCAQRGSDGCFDVLELLDAPLLVACANNPARAVYEDCLVVLVGGHPKSRAAFTELLLRRACPCLTFA